MIQNFDTLRIAALRDLAGLLSAAPKKLLGEVRLFDLVLVGDSRLTHTHGIYCFYDRDGRTCLYVGKVEGPQFIERLPSHLSLSEGSWFNQFMRGMKEEYASFERAALAARQCMLVIIPMPSQFVAPAERILIERLNPRLNKKRSKSGYGGAAHDMIVFGDILRNAAESKQPSLQTSASVTPTAGAPVAPPPGAAGR